MVTHTQDGITEFAFFRPTAQRVGLAGDFNGWKAEYHPLKGESNGWWRLRLNLKPGEYRFKYLVDGRMWEADYAAFGVEKDKSNGFQSVLWVRPKTLVKVSPLSTITPTGAMGLQNAG